MLSREKSMLKYITKSSVLCCLLTLAFSLALFSSAAAQNEISPKITLSQRLKLESQYRTLIEGIIKTKLAEAGMQTRQQPIATVHLEFDQAQLQKDAQSYSVTKSASLAKGILDFADSISGVKTIKPKRSTKTKDSGVRFGKLNLDITEDEFNSLIERPSLSGQGAVALTMQMPSITDSGFTYDPADYINKFLVDVSIPHIAPQGFDVTIEKVITTNLEISVSGNVRSEKLVSVKRLSELTSESSGFNGWFKELISPKNMSFGILLACLIMGMFILLATSLLGRAFARIAVGISDLKPAEESSDSESDVAAQVAATTIDITTKSEDSDSDSGRQRHDPKAAVNALTSEMHTIREQLAEVISENEQLFSELLRDIFYEKHGLEDIRDLLGFAGYRTIKPAFDKLPRSYIDTLQAYIEDNRKEQSSLLNGVEVAQSLYRDCVTRMTSGTDDHDIMDNLRQVLVEVDDDVLSAVVQEGSAEEAAYILKTLTIERGNRIMEDIPPELLRDASKLLDVESPNAHTIIEALIEKLNTTEVPKKKTSQSQLRFILRLARKSTVDTETQVAELIEDDNWDLKYAVMKSKFFYCYLKDLPADFLRQIADGFDVSTRARLLHVMDSKVKNLIINTYKEGSKLKEMVENELKLLDQDVVLKKELEKQRISLIENYMTKITDALDKEPGMYDIVIENQKKTTVSDKIEQASDAEASANQENITAA